MMRRFWFAGLLLLVAVGAAFGAQRRVLLEAFSNTG
jgi:fluoride ion exporter CrcB/FEX